MLLCEYRHTMIFHKKNMYYNGRRRVSLLKKTNKIQFYNIFILCVYNIPWHIFILTFCYLKKKAECKINVLANGYGK